MAASCRSAILGSLYGGVQPAALSYLEMPEVSTSMSLQPAWCMLPTSLSMCVSPTPCIEKEICMMDVIFWRMRRDHPGITTSQHLPHLTTHSQCPRSSSSRLPLHIPAAMVAMRTGVFLIATLGLSSVTTHPLRSLLQADSTSVGTPVSLLLHLIKQAACIPVLHGLASHSPMHCMLCRQIVFRRGWWQA